MSTWSGVAYACFIIDAYSRTIVGWLVAAHMSTDMVLDALSMASWFRGTQQGPWRTVDDVELATLGWVHWHNTTRLHGRCNDVLSVEFEAAFYAAQHADQLVGIQ